MAGYATSRVRVQGNSAKIHCRKHTFQSEYSREAFHAVSQVGPAHMAEHIVQVGEYFEIRANFDTVSSIIELTTYCIMEFVFLTGDVIPEYYGIHTYQCPSARVRTASNVGV